VRGSARAAVLSDWLTAWLGKPATVSVAESYRALAEAIETGAADVAWAPPAICARVYPRAGAMLTAVRYGDTACRAALVVRADSGIWTLDDLAGKRASWVDPLSTNGHLMALAHLREAGLDPARLLASHHFAGSYRDALADVAEMRAEVTSVFEVDGGSKQTLNELHDLLGPTAKDLALLATTAPAPFDALVISARAKEAKQIEAKLLELNRRARPPAMLLEVCRADRFTPARVAEYARFERFVDAFLE
jgi:ABC-type phosphate/phosphonate transport system substrate-binding protein